MQILVCCLHLVCWISVCWMQALVCCLPLVCRIWYAVCILYAGFSFTFLRVYSSKCWTFSFFVRASLFCIYYSFFCKFEWAIFALFRRFFLDFVFFLRWTRNSVINSYFGWVVSLICWRVDSHRGPVPELESAELAKNFIFYNCGSRSYIMLSSLGAETDVLQWTFNITYF